MQSLRQILHLHSVKWSVLRQVLKLSALSAEAHSEEPIDVVMRSCYPDKVCMSTLSYRCNKCLPQGTNGMTHFSAGSAGGEL